MQVYAWTRYNGYVPLPAIPSRCLLQVWKAMKCIHTFTTSSEVYCLAISNSTVYGGCQVTSLRLQHSSREEGRERGRVVSRRVDWELERWGR